MTIYIVDDDPGIVNILEDIVTKNFENSLVGTASNGVDAIKEIKNHKPDIVLLDFLLPDKDGLQIVRAVKDKYCQGIIMISEVSDKEMIAKAYKENIEFFISKPINVIEVISIIKKVSEYLKIKNTLNKFENTLTDLKIDLGVKKELKISDEQKLKKLYNKLGIVGSRGCDELIKAVIWTKKQQSDYTLQEMYEALIENSDLRQIDAVKKRIGRVITKAFRSMASLGIEDFMNPIFENYSGRLFDFSEMRKEMKRISGKSKQLGKINVRQFIESSIVLMEEIY